METTKVSLGGVAIRVGAIVMAFGLLFAACARGTTDRSAAGDSSETNPVNTVPAGETIAPPSTFLPTPPTADASQTSTTTTTGSASTSSSSSTTTITSATTTTTPAPEPQAVRVYPCATSVRLGPFEASVSAPGDCLTRNGLEWTSTKKVFVGGMEFRPVAADANFVFDPLNAHVHAVGYQALGSLLGGELLIDEGVIDWSFQYTPSQSAVPGWAMPIRNDAIKTSTIGKLRGLSGVASYPVQPVNGFPDYSVVWSRGHR